MLVILTATAMNAIRLFAWYEGVPLAKTRISSFAKLAPKFNKRGGGRSAQNSIAIYINPSC